MASGKAHIDAIHRSGGRRAKRANARAERATNRIFNNTYQSPTSERSVQREQIANRRFQRGLNKAIAYQEERSRRMAQQASSLQPTGGTISNSP